jgi:hypothetical protein
MYQPTRCEIVQFFRSRPTAKYGITVGVMAKARDDIPTTPCLFGGELEGRPLRYRGLFYKLISKFHSEILILQVLGMSKREEEKRLLPSGAKCRVMTNFNSFER